MVRSRRQQESWAGHNPGSVPRAIANLEVDLGFELFDRSAKLPVLTKHGEDMFIQ